MSSSNTRSAHKESAEIGSLGYLKLTAWRGVTWFTVPEQDRLKWEMGASRGCGMDAAGFGRGTGAN